MLPGVEGAQCRVVHKLNATKVVAVFDALPGLFRVESVYNAMVLSSHVIEVRLTDVFVAESGRVAPSPRIRDMH